MFKDLDNISREHYFIVVEDSKSKQILFSRHGTQCYFLNLTKSIPHFSSDKVMKLSSEVWDFLLLFVFLITGGRSVNFFLFFFLLVNLVPFKKIFISVCSSAGFRRRSNTVARRNFPHAAHRMDYMDFEDDSRGWWFDMDMVIIYIYSVNWIIGFIIFCFLCYFFFPL